MRRSVLPLAVFLLAGAPHLALAQAANGLQAPNAPLTPPLVLNRNGGGFLGSAFGNAGATAGATTVNKPGEPTTPASSARSGTVIGGVSHVGAGTSGLGLGLGNAVGGLSDGGTGAGAGGLGDAGSLGSSTGGITGAGRGFQAPTGGIKDAFNQGINTGGIEGNAIGAGVGGLKDANTLGAATGGTHEGNNAPRFRVQ